MTDATQPRTGRGTMLPVVGALAAALFALLAFASFASAASDPLGSGTTTIKLNKGFSKLLTKNGVKVLKVSPGKVSGTTVTLPVSGGSLDPTTGQGTVDNSGGFKFKAGKKNVALKNFVLDTTKKSLSAKLGKKNLKVASVAGLSFTREGFGTNVKIGKLKLTSKAAKELNTKLGLSGKNGKKGKRASSSKASSKGVFKANQLLGGSASATQPSTVTIVPGGNATLTTSLPTVAKLAKVGVKIDTVPPTTVTSAGPPPAYAFPIAGESISPTATAGIVKTTGGLKLVQNLEELGAVGAGTTTLTLGSIWVDLGAKTASVEVIVENPKTAKANLGNLGRSSIADVSLTGATVTADPTNHTVSVQNASATLQVVTAETLNSVFVNPIEEATKVPQEKFATGDPLGTFSFTAQTQ
ncbi:MAG: hypothetical protein ACHQCF_07270 [Solirubrobacterales bacterium]